MCNKIVIVLLPFMFLVGCKAKDTSNRVDSIAHKKIEFYQGNQSTFDSLIYYLESDSISRKKNGSVYSNAEFSKEISRILRMLSIDSVHPFGALCKGRQYDFICTIEKPWRFNYYFNTCDTIHTQKNCVEMDGNVKYWGLGNFWALWVVVEN